MIFFDNYQYIFQLFLAVLLGGLIGLEREYKGKEAGLQTYSSVALGSCLFTVIALFLAEANIIDPSAVIIAIAVGMGFIGAGAVFQGENTVKGLTTAAGLWVTAATGMAVGSRLYLLAICATFFVLVIFFGLGWLEGKFFKREKQ